MSYALEHLRHEQEATLTAPQRKYGFFAKVLFLFATLFFGKKNSLLKFKALEIIARVPYQAWEQVAYIAGTNIRSKPGFAKRLYGFVKNARELQDNVTWHLLILEELVQKKQLKENTFIYRLIPQLMAFFYYHLSWILFVIKPAWSYSLNIDFEDRAERAYMQYVQEHPELDQEPFESAFKEEYWDFNRLGDVFRRIALDKRQHKLQSLESIQKKTFL